MANMQAHPHEHPRRGAGGPAAAGPSRQRLLLPLLILAAALAAAFAAAPGVAPAQAAAADGARLAVPVVSAARLDGGAQRASFEADLTYAIPFNVYVLQRPYRVMIDLPDVDFRLKGHLRRRGAGLIRGVRYGRMGPGRARIVLDLAGPALIASSHVTEGDGAAPARLVVRLARTDEATFAALLASARASAPAPAADAEPLRETDKVPEDLPAITRAYRRLVEEAAAAPPPASIADLIDSSPIAFAPPRRKAPARAARAQDMATVARKDGRKNKAAAREKASGQAAARAGAAARKPLIVIDPGHGGKDPGALGPRGVKEKDIVLAFARKLAASLRATGRFRVLLTRSGDTFITLGDRVRFARRHGARLFISIHADKFRNRVARGAAIYTLSEKASDEEAAELARKENAADIIGGVDLGDENREIKGILIDLAMREAKSHSLHVARSLARRMAPLARLRPRPVRAADFRVLRNPDMPAVLVELGYVSNGADVRNMKSSRWRSRLARAMTRAIGHYFSTHLAWR